VSLNRSIVFGSGSYPRSLSAVSLHHNNNDAGLLMMRPPPASTDINLPAAVLSDRTNGFCTMRCKSDGVPLMPGTFAGNGFVRGVNLRLGAGLGGARLGARLGVGARLGAGAAMKGIMPAVKRPPPADTDSPFGRVMIGAIAAGGGTTLGGPGEVTTTSSSTVVGGSMIGSGGTSIAISSVVPPPKSPGGVHPKTS